MLINLYITLVSRIQRFPSVLSNPRPISDHSSLLTTIEHVIGIPIGSSLQSNNIADPFQSVHISLVVGMIQHLTSYLSTLPRDNNSHRYMIQYLICRVLVLVAESCYISFIRASSASRVFMALIVLSHLLLLASINISTTVSEYCSRDKCNFYRTSTRSYYFPNMYKLFLIFLKIPTYSVSSIC